MSTAPTANRPTPRGRPPIFDTQLAWMVAVLAALSVVAYWRGGVPLVRQGYGLGVDTLLRFSLIIAVSLLAAGVAQALIPREWIQTAFGREAGLRGILLATAAGAVTPSGPFVSMPIAALFLKSGAAAPSVVAFLTAWSVLALQRFVAWEVPFLGLRFALLRWAVSLALPILAGLATRAIVRG